MSRIHPVSKPQPAAEATLTAIHKNLGMVPNLYATVAHSPTVLNAFLTFNQSLTQGRLTAKQRELIALAIGQVNECQYCLSAHTLLAKKFGLTHEEIQSARKGEIADSLNHAIVHFARQVVLQRGELSDEQLSIARKHGIDDGLVIEIIAQVAVNTFTNYFNHIANTEIDFPVVDLMV